VSAQVALINNSVTPYRLHLHSRFVQEIPEATFWSVFTHEASNSPWTLAAPEHIRPVFFGPGENSVESHRGATQLHEWRKAGRIIRWIRENGIRAIVLGGYSDLGRLRLMAWSYQHHVPCFLFGDSNILADRASWGKRMLLPPLLRLCDGVLCCGRLGEEYFSRYGVPSCQIFRVPYEPDYDFIRSVPSETVESVRQRFRVLPDRRYIIYSGRLVAVKRVDLLLRAFFSIREARPDWDLIIAGDGPDRPVLQALCESAEATSRVIWAGFVNQPDQLAGLYASSSMLVLPSDFEPWGVVVTEAAVRMPVIASSVVGAAADLIHDGVNGRIFSAGDLESLIGCLLDVTTPAHLERMTGATAQCFSAWHTDSDPVAGLRSALRSVNAM
jgi:glycosyltransferase involved in cell wall biosynthesis